MKIHEESRSLLQCAFCGLPVLAFVLAVNLGALIIAYILLGVLDYNYGIMGPKTLFYLLRPPYDPAFERDALRLGPGTILRYVRSFVIQNSRQVAQPKPKP